MGENGQDRRKALRVDANLKLEVALPGAGRAGRTATVETINISSSGVYFRSDHFIEPMTKLAMELEVGVPAADEPDGRVMAPVACEGLVVRVSPEAEVEGCENYEVAVFFTTISPEGMTNLQRHISLLVQDED